MIEVADPREIDALDEVLDAIPVAERAPPSRAYREADDGGRSSRRPRNGVPDLRKPRYQDDDLEEDEDHDVRPRRRRRRERERWSPNFLGVLGGIAMMVVAVVWLVAGLAAGIFFIYPPILFIVGIGTIINAMRGD